MKRKVLRAALATLVTVAATGSVAAQGSTVRGIGVGHTDLGFVVGLGGIGDAGFSLGGRFERVFKQLPDLGDGYLGFEASLDWWKYDIGFGTKYDITYIAPGAVVNYHFNIKDNKKIDPFIGAGLAYWSVSTDFGGSYDSGIYFATRAGIRYFFSEKVAGYADAGMGTGGSINVGLMFGMAGAKAAAMRLK